LQIYARWNLQTQGYLLIADSMGQFERFGISDTNLRQLAVPWLRITAELFRSRDNFLISKSTSRLPSKFVETYMHGLLYLKSILV